MITSLELCYIPWNLRLGTHLPVNISHQIFLKGFMYVDPNNSTWSWRLTLSILFFFFIYFYFLNNSKRGRRGCFNPQLCCKQTLSLSAILEWLRLILERVTTVTERFLARRVLYGFSTQFYIVNRVSEILLSSHSSCPSQLPPLRHVILRIVSKLKPLKASW